MDRSESISRSSTREASMEGSSSHDPFGLGRRRRRIPASLEAYLTPQFDLPPRQGRTNGSSHYRTPQKAPLSSPPRNNVKALRVTLESSTAESSTSLLTTPVSNTSPPQQQHHQQNQESPAHWNVSRISPQDTLSILTPPDDERPATTARRASNSNHVVESSMASQTMRKQMLHLVNSLQTNLNESQEIREEQVTQLKSYESRQAALQQQVEALREETGSMTVEQGKQKEEFQRHYQAIHQECRVKDGKVQELEHTLQEEVRQTQQVQTSLQNLRLEHASLTQQLQQQKDAEKSLQEAQQQVEETSRHMEQQRLALLEKQERWHQEHRELKDESVRVESSKSSLQYERQLLGKERQQVQLLQKQLVEMQATQMELEETQQDEDDRLLQIAHQLDVRHSSLEDREEELEVEKKHIESQQRQQEEDMLEREAHLQESAQSIVSQQSMLETWNGTLQERQTKLEERDTQVKDIERAVSTKVDELTRLESSMRQQHDDLEQRSQSYEAKHLLTLQALEDLTAQRIDQESRLETALSNLEEVEHQTSKIKADNQHRRDAMQEKLKEAQNYLDTLTPKIAVATKELETITKQSQATLQLDEDNRQEAEKEMSLVQTQLHQVQDEIEDAESHKATLHLELLSLKGQLEIVQYAIQEERAAWEEEQAVAMDQEDIRRSEQMDVSRREIQEARETAKYDFGALQTELQAKQDQASQELIQQMDQIERMRTTLEATATSWMEKHVQLEVDRKECVAQQKRLDQLVAQLEGARDDHQWRSEELNRERERLETLLSTERQKHRDEMQRVGHAADDRVEELRQEHRDEMKDLTERFNSDVTELENRYNQIQQQLSQQELEHQAEISSLMEQKKQVETNCARLQCRSEECEQELSQLQQQIANLNSLDSEEHEKIRLLMERLESSNENVERKEIDLARREEELQEENKQAKKQVGSMSNANDDLQIRLGALYDKERKLATVQINLEKQEADLGVKKATSNRKLQRSAVQHLMHKIWREDKEIVSAAFSKWLRVTMMESTAEEAAVIEQGEIENLSNVILHRNELLQLKEAEISAMKIDLQDTKKELKTMKMNHSDTSESIEAMKADLNAQTLALHDAEERLTEQQVRFKMQAMMRDEELKIEYEQLTTERKKLESDRAAMAQLDKFLQTKQKQINAQDSSRESPKETAALEQKLAGERIALKEAHAELAQKEQDVLDRIDMVQKAEMRLLQREEQLSTEATGYKRAEERVRKLADQLQQREETIAQKEGQLSFSLREFNEAQVRVRMMAQKLKEKGEELEAEKERLGIGNSRF